MVSETTFTIVCIGGSTITLHSSKVEESQQWICALLEDDPEPENQINFDSFELLSEIGYGSNAHVFLAKQKENGQYYAVKTFDKNNKGILSHVTSEKNVLMIANSPFIAKLFYAFQTPTKYYLVMEYAEGGDLSKYISNSDSRRRLTHKQAKQVIAETALALESLHRSGIVYRDLKPQNILVKSNGHVKLNDFGLAKDIVHDGTSKTLCGTLAFVAPEMILKENYDFRVDWWALGVTCYEMFFGRLPFSGANQKQVFDAVAYSEPQIPEGTDELISSFVLDLMAKDPAKRLTDVFSHPFMADMRRDDVLSMRYDAGFRPLSFVSNVKEETKEYQDMIVPGFSFTYEEELVNPTQ